MSIHVAVAGAGYWGKNLVRNMHELGCLRTVCDADPNARRQIQAAHPDVPVIANYEDILADPAIQAVMLATPAETHFEMARAALAAGKDVFVEKPLAMHVEEGEKLVRQAAEARRVLMVGHILQYHPAVVRLKELIAEGRLGALQYIYSNRLNMGKFRTEENILWSFAPHDLSVILSLLNEMPESAACQGSAYLDTRVYDVTLSRFSFTGGVRAHVYVSWLHPFKEQRLVVVGSEQMAVFDDTRAEKLTLYPHRVEWKDRVPTAIKADSVAVPLPDAEPLREECRHFLECVRERKTPRTDGVEGVRVLSLLDACQRSMTQNGNVVPLNDNQGRSWFAHETACVDHGAEIGEGTKIWHYSHIQSGAQIGANCVIGQNVNIDGGAVIGNGVKIQNNVSVYSGVTVEDYVFLGPSCVLTNVTNPRSEINRRNLYEKTLIRRGATVGANATVVPGVTIGRHAFIGAGAVVTKDVPDYALMVGNPARRNGWMSRHGHPLRDSDESGILRCRESGYRYREVEPGILRCLDHDEDVPLPDEQSTAQREYNAY